jgi:hypothetical protein
MTIEESLVERYGVLMTITNLADVLEKTPESLRYCLRSNSDCWTRFNGTRLKIGRRVYFRTIEIAQLLES